MTTKAQEMRALRGAWKLLGDIAMRRPDEYAWFPAAVVEKADKILRHFPVSILEPPDGQALAEWEEEVDEARKKASPLGVPEIERLADLVLPKPGSRWIWQPDNPQYREDVEVEAVRWNGEEFWISTRGARRIGLTVVDKTHYNELDHFLDSASPCPPAPPPSVSPAEETSSGEEGCTAEGAEACCKDMEFSLEDGYLYREKGYAIALFEMAPKKRCFIRIVFCPWCGTKLNEET